jgi:hypothetical protein
MRLPISILSTTLFAGALAVPAASETLEKDRQAVLCMGMVQNRYLPNGTYVDCISDEYAIEVDWSNKWAEAIGQSLMYASELERLPGIILLCKPDQDPGLCLKHAYLIEQTVSYWRIGMTVWQCDAEAASLDECNKRVLMQD